MLDVKLKFEIPCKLVRTLTVVVLDPFEFLIMSSTNDLRMASSWSNIDIVVVLLLNPPYIWFFFGLLLFLFFFEEKYLAASFFVFLQPEKFSVANPVSHYSPQCISLCFVDRPPLNSRIESYEVI